MKRIFLALLWISIFRMAVFAQSTDIRRQEPAFEDSTKTEVRRYTARNFSEERSLNLYWETSPNHDYSLKQNGQKVENGRMRSEHIIKFTTIVPLVDKKKFTLNVKGAAYFHTLETMNDEPGASSILYEEGEDGFSYYKAEVNASYMFNLFKKPLIVRASMSGDGWNNGIEKMDGAVTALYLIKNSEQTKFYVGIHFTALYDQLPIMPLVIYTHQFNPHLGIDISLPSRMFLRYQFGNRNRISLGGVIESNQFYYKPRIGGLPETALFKVTNLKAEFDYEYIINKHFFFIVRGGITKPFKSGFYKTNRKGNGDGDPLMEYSQPLTPFFYLGFSYNIWK